MFLIKVPECPALIDLEDLLPWDDSAPGTIIYISITRAEQAVQFLQSRITEPLDLIEMSTKRTKSNKVYINTYGGCTLWYSPKELA